jgi:hypothetical protein
VQFRKGSTKTWYLENNLDIRMTFLNFACDKFGTGHPCRFVSSSISTSKLSYSLSIKLTLINQLVS